MKQQDFEQQHQALWQEFEQMLEAKPKVGDQRDFPRFYQTIAHHLAMAKQRRYSANLIERLNSWVVLGHERFYGQLPRYQSTVLFYLFYGFPQTLRRNARFVYTASALFFLPGILFFFLCWTNDEIIYSLMSYEQVKEFEQMYSADAETFGKKRASDTDLMMFCYYIGHNIGISFQTFASGVLYGIGSIFFLIYNGIFLGAVFGHITQVGYTETLFPFVIGHGAFELTAIALAGAAGLKLGWALISPGNYRRLDALKIAAKDAVIIMYGTTTMLLIAAFIEAFWSSSSSLVPAIKYTVGSLLWLGVLCYFFFAGRGQHAVK